MWSEMAPYKQRTLMTLWSIARSPLIMGGDLRHLDAATLALLTNRDVLKVNQASTDNRPHSVKDGTRIWLARPEGGHGLYLALFNLTDQAKDVGIDLKKIGAPSRVMRRELWTGREAGAATGRVSRMVRPHGAELYYLA